MLSQLTNACEECTLLKLVLISIHSSILMYTKTYDVYQCLHYCTTPIFIYTK